MIIVDASVAMKWFVEEDGHAEATRLKGVFEHLAAPDFLLVEVANIAWKKVRHGELSAAMAKAVVADLRSSPFSFIPTETLVEAALAASLEIDHPVYDCLYLVAAAQLHGVCLTADRKLVSRAGRTRFAPYACALADVDSVIRKLGLT